MAGTTTGYRYDFGSIGRDAGEDLSSSRYRFVNLNADGDAVQAGAGEQVIGSLYNSPASGEDADIQILGVAQVEAGASLDENVKVTPDADGKAVSATAASVDTTTSNSSEDVAGDEVAGITMEAASNGEIVPVLLVHAGLT